MCISIAKKHKKLDQNFQKISLCSTTDANSKTLPTTFCDDFGLVFGKNESPYINEIIGFSELVFYDFEHWNYREIINTKKNTPEN